MSINFVDHGCSSLRTIEAPWTYIALLVASSLVVAGCSEQLSEEKSPCQPVSSVQTEEASSSSFSAPSEGQPSELTEAERIERLDRRARVDMQLSRVIRKASDWREADRSVRKMLDNPSPIATSLFEQMAADAMLKQKLLAGAPTPEKKEAVGFYTGLMLKNGNPQGPLLADALERLQGHWSKERIERASQQALETTRRQLANQQEEGNENQKLVAKITGKKPGTYQRKKMHELRRAAEKLETMANAK